MKITLLLHDDARGPTHLLQNAVRARAPLGEIKTVAACNCDRWGPPCLSCVERIAQPAPKLPILMPTKK